MALLAGDQNSERPPARSPIGERRTFRRGAEAEFGSIGEYYASVITRRGDVREVVCRSR